MVKKVTNAPEPNSWHTDLGMNLIVLLDVFFAVYSIVGYSRLLHQIKEGIRLENSAIALTTYLACRCVDCQTECRVPFERSEGGKHLLAQQKQQNLTLP